MFFLYFIVLYLSCIYLYSAFTSVNRLVRRRGLLVFHRINGVELTIPALQKV